MSASLEASAANTVFAAVFALVIVAVMLYSLSARQGGGRWWVLLTLLAAAAIVGTLVESAWLRVVLIDVAAFAAVAMVWATGTAAAHLAARRYLALLVPAVACIAAGMALAGTGDIGPAAPARQIALACLIVGFGLKLALVPFYVWLPGVAGSAAPMTTALIVSIVDIAAFAELLHLRHAAPWIFVDERGLWLALALLSMFAGALLALAQRDLKRMLAFSTIDDMGYLLLGLAAGSEIGVMGAALAALSHTLVKVLLFGAVGLAERGTGAAVTLDTRGLASICPVSGAAFIVGALGMIGVPPLFGFAGRWRLYEAGAELGGPLLLLVMAAATALALLYYARAIHVVWLGPAAAACTSSPSEPGLAAGVLIALMGVVLLLGLAPGLVTRLLG